MSQPEMQPDQQGYPTDSVVAVTGKRLREALKEHAKGESLSPPSVPAGMFEGYLPSSLCQIYSAREAFTSSSQNALTTLLVSYTAGSALIFWLVTSDESPPLGRLVLVCVLAIAAFATPWLLRNAFMWKARAGYDLYVAACVHSAIVHNALNVPVTHLFVDHVLSCHGATGRLDEKPDKAKHPAHRHFPPMDTWDFKPGKMPERGSNQPDKPALTSVGRIVAVWRARGRNLYWYYKLIFVWGTFVVAILALLMVSFVVWAGVTDPTWIWH